VNDGTLRAALDQLAPHVPNDAEAVLDEVKPRFRQARRQRRLRVAAVVAAAGLVAAGAVVLAGILTEGSTTNPPLTTGPPVPFTLGETERD